MTTTISETAGILHSSTASTVATATPGRRSAPSAAPRPGQALLKRVQALLNPASKTGSRCRISTEESIIADLSREHSTIFMT